MLRYVVDVDLCDVARDFMIAGMVGTVRLDRIFVPFAGKDTAAIDCLKSHPQTANTGEEINECEAPGGGMFGPHD